MDDAGKLECITDCNDKRNATVSPFVVEQWRRGGKSCLLPFLTYLEHLYLVFSGSYLQYDAEKEVCSGAMNMNLPHIIQACV